MGRPPHPAQGRASISQGWAGGTLVHPDAWDPAWRQGSGEDTRGPFWQEGYGLGGRSLRGRIHC